MKRPHRPLRSLLSQLPYQHKVHDLWWSRKARTQEILTQWNRDTGVVFIHTPKCAGTSVYKILHMPPPAAGTHIPMQAYHAADPKLAPNLESFTFVRNPWDRFVSAFHYLAFHAEGARDQSFAQACFGDTPDFATFTNRFLSDRMYRNTVMSQPHFRPQVHYVFSADGKHKPKHIFQIENGMDQLDKITQHLGIALTLESVNRSDRSGYRSYFDVKTAAGIGQVYGKDAELLKYEFKRAK